MNIGEEKNNKVRDKKKIITCLVNYEMLYNYSCTPGFVIHPRIDLFSF